MYEEDILGDMMYSGALSYYAQLQAHNTMLNQAQKTFSTLIAGQGVFGYEPKASYLFGIPRSISAGAIVLDIPMVGTSAISDNNHTKLLNYQRADMYASALEHIVPEQMFSTLEYQVDGFSTAKAFQKANESGQKIFFITQENMNEILPQLNHTASTMNAITNALNAGKEVTVHQNQITLQGYSGTGYRVFDPITGDSADMISGGLNGGSSVIENLMNLLSIVYGMLGAALGEFYKATSNNKKLAALIKVNALLSFGISAILAYQSNSPFVNTLVVIAVTLITIYVTSLIMPIIAGALGASASSAGLAIIAAGIASFIGGLGTLISQVLAYNNRRYRLDYA